MVSVLYVMRYEMRYGAKAMRCARYEMRDMRCAMRYEMRYGAKACIIRLCFAMAYLSIKSAYSRSQPVVKQVYHSADFRGC